jgi:hypothetical protein
MCVCVQHTQQLLVRGRARLAPLLRLRARRQPAAATPVAGFVLSLLCTCAVAAASATLLYSAALHLLTHTAMYCSAELHCTCAPTLRCILPPRVPCCSALNGLSLSGSLPAALIHRHPGLTSLWVSSAARGLGEEGERLVKLASKGRRRREEAGLTVSLLCSELRLG